MWISFSHLTDLNVRVVTQLYKLFPVYTRVDVAYINIFSNGVVEPWNSFPAEPHHVSSLSAFNTFLKGVGLSKFAQQ